MATLFLFIKQPIILAYIVVGFAAGPGGFKWIENADHIEQISHFGVILLLFLLGLHLQPKKLLHLFRKTALLTFSTSFIFGLAAYGVSLLFQFSQADSLVVGAAMIFSSTVIGLKLIPTTILHHRHTGEMMTSVLLIQDIIAIIVLLFLAGDKQSNVAMTFGLLVVKLGAMAAGAFLIVSYVIVPLFKKFDTIQEYTFLVTLGWCLSCAEGAHLLGLSYEMGAFLGGISIASSPIALVIAEELKPLREFFLILFFFAIGAKFDLNMSGRVLAAGIVLAGLLLVLKPLVFRFGFRKSGEEDEMSKELGVRLGQASEFSLLVSYAAISAGALSSDGALFIQLTTVITFAVSTYWVVFNYRTPISRKTELLQD